jgi:replication protein C-like
MEKMGCNHCTGWMWAEKAITHGVPIVKGTDAYLSYPKQSTAVDSRQPDDAVDSPTGRRWGRRDAKTGKIVEAYGFDLSPIGLRHAEFVAVAERAAVEERERAALRRRLTIARKAIQQIAETAIEHQLTDRDWHYWLAEALTLC